MYNVDFLLDSIALFFVMFSDDIILLPLIVIGFIWIDRDVFYHGACLVLASMVINFALKITFNLFFTSLLGSADFAFPSGHMYSASVFYGWIAYVFTSSILRFIIVVLLSGIGCGLIYFNYHDYGDILGSMLFALITGIQYLQYLRKLSPQHLISIVSAMVIILLLYIKLFYGVVPKFVWLGAYTLLGFQIGALHYPDYKIQNYYAKVFATIICFLLIAMMYYIAQLLQHSEMPTFIYQVTWIVIGLAPVWSLNITKYLQSLLNFSRG